MLCFTLAHLHMEMVSSSTSENNVLNNSLLRAYVTHQCRKNKFFPLQNDLFVCSRNNNNIITKINY